MRNARAQRKIGRATGAAFSRGFAARARGGYHLSEDDVMRAAGERQFRSTSRHAGNVAKGRNISRGPTASRKKIGRVTTRAVGKLNRMNKKGHIQKQY